MNICNGVLHINLCSFMIWQELHRWDRSSTTSGLQMFSFILSKVNSWIKFLTLHAVWFYYYNSLYSQREANFQSILILNHPWPFISESAICRDISYWHNRFALLFQCSNNLVSFSAQELVVDRSITIARSWKNCLLGNRYHLYLAICVTKAW